MTIEVGQRNPRQETWKMWCQTRLHAPRKRLHWLFVDPDLNFTVMQSRVANDKCMCGRAWDPGNRKCVAKECVST